MRLRLTVQRNNLPTSNILWSVPDTASAQAYTFVRLLEDVNRILPLEAEQWGLEDYIVELEGFECLHFSPVLQTLKEDDRLSIRPLLTAEVRSRTLCGRTQISKDGRHLVDGIPFGRPYLKQPLRPAMSIPPRKRLRVEEDTVAGTEAPESAGFITVASEAQSSIDTARVKKNRKEVQFSQADEEGSDDSENDEDFVPGHVSEGSVDSDSNDDTSSTASEASVPATKANKRRRSLEHETSPEASSGSETDTSSDTSSDSDSASPLEADLEAETSADSDSDSDSASDSSDSDSDSDSDSSAPEVLSSKPDVPPWSGSKETRRRNFRRKQLVKLKQLKAKGKLHPDATYADLQAYLGTPKEPDSPTRTPAHAMSESTGKRKRLDEDAEDQQTQAQTNESAELERRRMELMARLADTVSDVEMTPVELSTSTVEQVGETTTLSASPAVSLSKRSTATPTPPTKRLRPNVSAISRILQRQAVNIERKTSKSVNPPVDDPEPDGASDPNFWKSRINLSAFECWDEEHELSAPPFPFEQHWDPASKLMREKKQAKQKKKARKSEQPAELLVYDNEDQEPEDTPVLDYDDSPETMKAASDPSDAVESQILQEVELATKSDFPRLPEDVESLPTLQPHDIQVGAIVVFKVYAIDPVTVTPHISEYKTAIVEKEGDSGHGAGTFRLKLADRDIPHKAGEVVDKKGRSVKNAVSGFRMYDEDEDEDEDNSVWEGTFGELVEPKLLKAVV